jgi:hypothetical protein
MKDLFAGYQLLDQTSPRFLSEAFGIDNSQLFKLSARLSKRQVCKARRGQLQLSQQQHTSTPVQKSLALRFSRGNSIKMSFRMAHHEWANGSTFVDEWQRKRTAQSVAAGERGELNLKGRPGRAASALVTVCDGHLRGQAFLKHSSCGLVESLTTQLTTDETVNKR